MKKRITTIALAFALVAAASRADVVLDWNENTLDAIRADRTNPPRATRHLALVHVAVYEAVNGLLGGFDPYLLAEHGPDGASPEAAAAAAASTASTPSCGSASATVVSTVPVAGSFTSRRRPVAEARQLPPIRRSVGWARPWTRARAGWAG